MNTVKPISELFEEEFLGIEREEITLRSILESVHERGFGFILFLIAIPMALPIPVPPGINVILASPLILLTAQQMIGRHTIWLPKKLLDKSFTREKFTGLIRGTLPWIKKLEIFIKPRLGFITQGVFSHLIGLAGLIMALSVMVPLPLTNTVPSFGIAMMAIGVIMRDGLAVIVGMMVGLAWVGLLGYFALYFGMEGIDILKQTIKSYL